MKFVLKLLYIRVSRVFRLSRNNLDQMQSGKRVLTFCIVSLPFLLAIVLNMSPYPWDVEETLRAIRIIENENNPKKMASNLRKLVNTQPWKGDLWEQIGMYEAEASAWEEATYALQEADNLSMLSADGRFTLGVAYNEIGNKEAALKTWQTMIDDGIATEEVYNRVVLSQREKGDISTAIETLHLWRNVYPENPQTSFQLGLFLASVQQEEAVSYLLIAAEQDNDLEEKVETIRLAINSSAREEDESYSHMLIGRALGSIGEWDLAAFSFEESIRLTPRYSEAWAFLGEAHERLDKDGGEELLYAQAINPNSVITQYLIALYWHRHNRPELSLVFFEAVSKEEPEQAAWQVGVGNALAELGDVNSALQHYQRAVELDPRNIDYWRTLARFCVLSNISLNSIGLPAAREVMLLTPHDPEALDLMGLVFLNLDDLVSAERFLHQAIQIDDSCDAANLHLGQLYIQIGQTDQAITYLSKAAEQSEEGKEVNHQALYLLDRYYKSHR